MKLIIKPMQDPSVRLDIKNKFIDAVRYRKNLTEAQWNLNERGIYGINGTMSTTDIDTSEAGIRDFIINSQHDDNDTPDVVINYAFRDVRLIHAQMSANPPVVTARPSTADGEDIRRAEAANFVLEFGKDYHKITEHVDLCNLSTIVYGTGYLITAWNPLGGELVSYDPKTGETEMEGEIKVYSPDTWDIWVDAKAKRVDDIRFFIEKQELPLDLAQAMFPEHWQKLLEQSNPNAQDGDSYAEGLRDVNLQQEQSIYIYKYYEKGLPINAMQGRFCFLDKAGEVIGKVDINPYQFVTSIQGKDEEAEVTPMPSAKLPLHILTDVDVPCQIYGKSFLDWSLQSQDSMNRLDSMRMDNVRAAGVTRMVIPEDANIPEDKITDDAFEIITTSSNQTPHYINPPSLFGDVDKVREILRSSIDELAGVNDAMLGESKRETSGYQMSYATNQANMVRRRLFNKYIMFVQEAYQFYLNLAIKHWDLPKTIEVLGSENAYDSLDISGQDISGGYNIKVEYGSAFSLDPTTKRQELLELKESLIEGGMTPQQFVEALAIGNTKNSIDMMQLGRKRQEEIIRKMQKTKQLIQPKEYEDHVSYLAYLNQFVNKAEFRNMSPEDKALVIEHRKLREQMVGEQQAATPPAGAGAPPAGPMGGGMPPMGGGMPPMM